MNTVTSDVPLVGMTPGEFGIISVGLWRNQKVMKMENGVVFLGTGGYVGIHHPCCIDIRVTIHDTLTIKRD